MARREAADGPVKDSGNAREGGDNARNGGDDAREGGDNEGRKERP